MRREEEGGDVVGGEETRDPASLGGGGEDQHDAAIASNPYANRYRNAAFQPRTRQAAPAAPPSAPRRSGGPGSERTATIPRGSSSSSAVVASGSGTPASADGVSTGTTTSTEKRQPPPKPRLVLDMEKRAEERRLQREKLEEKRQQEQKMQQEQQQLLEAEQARLEWEKKRDQVLARRRRDEEQKQLHEERQRRLDTARENVAAARGFRRGRLVGKGFLVLREVLRRARSLRVIAGQYRVETLLFNGLSSWQLVAKTLKAARMSAAEGRERKARLCYFRRVKKFGFLAWRAGNTASHAESCRNRNRIALRSAVSLWRKAADGELALKVHRATKISVKWILRRMLPVWREGIEQQQIERHKSRLLEKAQGWLADMEVAQ